MTQELQIIGIVQRGHGKFSDMVIPGRHSLSNRPDDWPEKLAAGSLNVALVSGLNDARLLDTSFIRPTFLIPRSNIANNELNRDAQVWRASLNGFSCWLLRRFGSGYWDRVELVSEVVLRTHLNLSENQGVSLRVYGNLT